MDSVFWGEWWMAVYGEGSAGGVGDWIVLQSCGWFIFSTNSCRQQSSAWQTDRQWERQISKKRKKTEWIQELRENEWQDKEGEQEAEVKHADFDERTWAYIKLEWMFKEQQNIMYIFNAWTTFTNFLALI